MVKIKSSGDTAQSVSVLFGWSTLSEAIKDGAETVTADRLSIVKRIKVISTRQKFKYIRKEIQKLCKIMEEEIKAAHCVDD